MHAVRDDRTPSLLQRLIAVLIVYWPAVPMAVAVADADLPPRAMLLSWSLFVLAAMAAAGFAATLGRLLVVLVSALLSVYCTLCTALALYRLYTHQWLDLALLTAVPADTLATARLFLGTGTLAAGAAILLAHAAIYTFALTAIAAAAAAEPRARVKTGIATVVLAASLAFTGTPHRDLLIDYSMARRTAGIRPLVDRTRYAVAPAEAVFLIQLESLNALAVNREYDIPTPDGMPVMRALAAEGILLPHMWNHDVQTHRAQQGFLCGAVRNLGMNWFLDQVPFDGDCLPALFRKAGYKTVFLKGVADPHFAGADETMPRIGYSDVRFARDLMHPGDRYDLWGVEERTFFARAFEYLRKTYKPGERLFVHIAVSAHHVGFSRSGKNDADWFRAPHEEQVREYVASAQQQDLALATLEPLLDELTGGNAHVFIFGDHSYPAGLYGSTQPHIGATIDNFVTPMLYLPPRSRAGEFALGRTIEALHGQSDLLPTLVELTTRRPQPNSLVPFLLRTPPPRFVYEPCHVMTQPFGYRAVATAHGDRLDVYGFADRCIETFELTHGPLRQKSRGRTCGVAFEEYERRTLCGRYR